MLRTLFEAVLSDPVKRLEYDMCADIDIRQYTIIVRRVFPSSFKCIPKHSDVHYNLKLNHA
jgi:hypothetical protein